MIFISASTLNDKFSGQSRGFGFVKMPDTAAAKKAMTELDSATVERGRIRVTEARPKEDRPSRGDDSGYKKRW